MSVSQPEIMPDAPRNLQAHEGTERQDVRARDMTSPRVSAGSMAEVDEWYIPTGDRRRGLPHSKNYRPSCCRLCFRRVYAHTALPLSGRR